MSDGRPEGASGLVPEELRRTWEEVARKAEELRRLDVDRLLHGADGHGYEFGERLSSEALAGVERGLGLSLPPELAYLYTAVGNGGAGPYDGLCPAQGLSRWSLQEYTEEHVDLLTDDEGEALEADAAEAEVRGWFERIGVDLTTAALVCVLDRFYEHTGCLYQLFVVCGGPGDGALVAWAHGVDYPQRQPGTLGELYLRWLSREIALFQLLRDMARARDDIEELWRDREALAGGDPLQVLIARHGFEDDTYNLWRADSFVRLLESAILQRVLTDDERWEFYQLERGWLAHISPEVRSKFREALHRFHEGPLRDDPGGARAP